MVMLEIIDIKMSLRVLTDGPLTICKINRPLNVWTGPLHSDNYLHAGLNLLKNGAKWGDLEVYTIEENIEILAKSKVEEIEIEFGI